MDSLCNHDAIDLIFHQGKLGETYNIGGHNEWKNIDLVHLLCDIMDRKLGNVKGKSRGLITYVKDRSGHDMRYAIDASKIEKELGFKPSVDFKEGYAALYSKFSQMKKEKDNNESISREASIQHGIEIA